MKLLNGFSWNLVGCRFQFQLNFHVKIFRLVVNLQRAYLNFNTNTIERRPHHHHGSHRISTQIYNTEMIYLEKQKPKKRVTSNLTINAGGAKRANLYDKITIIAFIATDETEGDGHGGRFDCINAYPPPPSNAFTSKGCKDIMALGISKFQLSRKERHIIILKGVFSLNYHI